MKTVLGISSFYHDSAAAIIQDGNLIAAVQEERFTRKKHDANFPINSINYLLRESKIDFNQIDSVVFYDKPFLKFERLLETYVAFAPRGIKSFMNSMPIWLREKLFLKTLLIKELRKIYKLFDKNKLFFSEHHFSHASSAFYPSPFKEALILTIDGVGEWTTTSVAIGKENKIKIVKEINFPHSIGLLYSAFTFYLGFKVNSGEYKVMGLAPYGKPKYVKLILDNLINIKEDGSFRLNMRYFDYATGLKMINKNFENLFNKQARDSNNEEINQFHMDIAASIQEVLNLIILKITRYIFNKYKIQNLCLAGGVALNCVSNSKILNDKRFKNLWIQPASGDAGGAIGAALGYWYNELKNKREINENDSMKGSYLGPSFSNDQVENYLKECNAIYYKHTEKEIVEKTINEITNGKVVGWFQGRMEFGPRALGNRSILGDPRSKEMQKVLNLKIKYRESFRPFAPSVLNDHLKDWFEIDTNSPYMLLTAEVKNNKRIEIGSNLKEGLDKLSVIRSEIPAVTHVDFSARVQTVDKKTNPKYHNLIYEFYKKTNCPILINTSFNVRGEPIVCNPRDAFNCFMGTEMDVLVIENFILFKKEQKTKNNNKYFEKFELD